LELEMKITKRQLRRIIKEEKAKILAEDEFAGMRTDDGRISSQALLDLYRKEQGLDQMSRGEAMTELEKILDQIRETSNDDRSSQMAGRALDLLSLID
jgi:hypothetical protein